jgi:hypothetical protein
MIFFSSSSRDLCVGLGKCKSMSVSDHSRRRGGMVERFVI